MDTVYDTLGKIGIVDYSFVIFTIWRMIAVGSKGALREFFLWVGIAVGFFLAWNVSIPVIKAFDTKRAGDFLLLTTAVAVFFVIFSILFFRRLGSMLDEWIRAVPILSKLDVLFGVVVGALEGFLFLFYIVFAIALSEPKSPFLRGSLLAWMTIPLGDVAVELISEKVGGYEGKRSRENWEVAKEVMLRNKEILKEGGVSLLFKRLWSFEIGNFSME
jgi:uncharacterized membrane protein required for colicin V production